MIGVIPNPAAWDEEDCSDVTEPVPPVVCCGVDGELCDQCELIEADRLDETRSDR